MRWRERSGGKTLDASSSSSLRVINILSYYVFHCTLSYRETVVLRRVFARGPALVAFCTLFVNGKTGGNSLVQAGVASRRSLLFPLRSVLRDHRSDDGYEGCETWGIDRRARALARSVLVETGFADDQTSQTSRLPFFSSSSKRIKSRAITRRWRPGRRPRC